MVIQNVSMMITGLILALVYSWKLALVTLSVAPLIVLSSGMMVVVSTVLCRDKIGCVVSQI